jgi:hypothetical protein
LTVAPPSSAAPSEPGVRLLLESALLLGLARVLVLCVPFRLYARAIGRDGESPDAPAPPLVHRVRRAIQAVSGRVPWRSRCLEQALAAKAMLRSRGISSTLYLAVAHETTLEAHAWVRSGDVCVTGEVTFDRYTVVARFADPAPR